MKQFFFLCKIYSLCSLIWNPRGTAAGLGWVIHSPSGIRTFKCSTSQVTSAPMAEALALLEAVKAGTREELKVVCFEADSSQLIDALNSGSCIPELYGILADIISFASIFKFVSFVWISRERNGQADMLAKTALLAAETIVVEGTLMAPTN